MSLNGNTLGSVLKSATDSFNDQAPPVDATAMDLQRKNYWNAVGNAIVSYLKNNTEVSTVVNTTGTAAAQTGTGTGGLS